jgi:hypothetical protein
MIESSLLVSCGPIAPPRDLNMGASYLFGFFNFLLYHPHRKKSTLFPIDNVLKNGFLKMILPLGYSKNMNKFFF